MSNYYTKQDAKVRIAHELMNRGWNIEGYRADESDSMTDYWSPAHWGGIATKNGFVLVVDNRYTAEVKEITKYNPAGNLSFEDREKIQKLEAITTERGATAGEEENAKALIEKIQSKTMDQPAHEVVGMTTAHMGNPKGSIWHIEKDGRIYDKGNGLTKFSDMPEEYEFDIIKMEYTDRYKEVWTGYDENGQRQYEERKLSKETEKIINDFKSLILRFERVVNGMNTMGDGTKETEEQAKEQQIKAGYEKVTITETKTSIKPIEVNRKTIQLDDILSFKTMHGGYWKVINIWQNSKGVNCYTYEILGSEKRGYQQLKNAKRYYQTETQINKAIEQGSIKIHTMQEVNEDIQIEKWVKIDKTQKSKNTYNSKQEKVQDKKQTTITEQSEENKTILNYEYTITEDIDTRDNSPLWVLKLKNKVDYDEFCNIRDNILKPIKGYYSKFKSGFIFKYNPTEILQDNTTITAEQKQFKTQQAEKTNLLEKIKKSINNLQEKINGLSSDYKVNTWKRMKEQEGRDSKINSYNIDIKLLQYVQTKLLDNLPITALEKYLIVGSFRDKIHQYYIQKYGRYPREIKFPCIDYSLPLDGWYNKEVPQTQKWFQKYDITDTKQLNQVIDEYKIIYNSIDRYISPKEQQIKKMTNEFKMQQKGDINFTPAKVVEQMINIADLDNNSIVLEPSAGIGNIADKIKEVTNNIEICEQRADFCELLKLKDHNIIGNDFLKLDKYNYYDCIIMNPPFSAEQEHLQHAYKLLKEGGKIISITSPSWTFNHNRKSEEFRQWFDNVGGEIVQKLESGTFEMTGVNSQIIIINKDSNIIREAI